MPQASERLRHALGHYDDDIESDRNCQNWLEAAGFWFDNAGRFWSPWDWSPQNWAENRRLADAVDYLVDEWDYSYEGNLPFGV